MDAEAVRLTRFPVLCYHALSPDWPAALSIAPDRFATHLELLAKRGYRGVTFADLAAGRAGGRAVAITFDDAYRSVLELGLPALEHHGWPATVYVPTSFPDRPGPMQWAGIDGWLGTRYEQELTPLSWDELRHLGRLGWEIGSHTRSHPRLTTLSDRELADELRGSREACEDRIGEACRTVAYPYGDVDARVERAAAVAGYAAGAALPRRPYTPRPLAWPRVGVYNKDDARTLRLKLSLPVRAALRSPLGAAAERLADWRAVRRAGN